MKGCVLCVTDVTLRQVRAPGVTDAPPLIVLPWTAPWSFRMTMRLAQLTSIKVCQTSMIRDLQGGVQRCTESQARCEIIVRSTLGPRCSSAAAQWELLQAGVIHTKQHWSMLYCWHNLRGSNSQGDRGIRPASSHRCKTPTRRIKNEIHARPTVATH